MLHIARKTGQLSFDKLLDLYRESILKRGRELAPEEETFRQIRISEDDFYNYLSSSFFRTEDAVYAIWEEGGRYFSALRLEPFQDGLLLEALETVPDERGRGYASKLIRDVQEWLVSEKGSVKVYSHINKRNLASLAVHRTCGFKVIMDHAVYIDGSVNSVAYTLCWENNFEKTEIYT